MQVITENKLVPKLRFGEFNTSYCNLILGEVSDVRDGTHDSPKYIKEGFPLITSKNLMSNGEISFENVNLISEYDYLSINKRSKVDLGDILFGMIGTIGNPVIVKDKEFAIKNVALIKQQMELLNIYLIYYLDSSYIQKQFYRQNAGGTQKFIALGLIRKLNINAPSLTEQQKIASFLSAEDKKLQQLTKKKDLLEAYKKGVMQKIFSQELRFKDDNGNNYPNWEEKKLGELTYKVGKKNKENISYPIYSINNQEGFLLQSEQFKGLDSNARGYDISIYKIVNEKTFAYNPARINVGSIGYCYNLNEIIISSLYVCFKTNKELEDLYLLAYIDSHIFNKDILRYQEGGVRQYLFYENFSRITIPLPLNDEQKKITNFLSSIDKKIDLVSTQIENTKDFKKGLLQQMFV